MPTLSATDGNPARIGGTDDADNPRACSHISSPHCWHLTEDLKIRKIAIFYQDDAFGRAGLSGFKKAMDKRGMEIAGQAA